MRRTTASPILREKGVFDFFVCDFANPEETSFAPRPTSFPAFSRNEGEGTIFAKRNACEEEGNEGPRVSPCYADSNARRTGNAREEKRGKTSFVAIQLSSAKKAPTRSEAAKNVVGHHETRDLGPSRSAFSSPLPRR